MEEIDVMFKNILEKEMRYILSQITDKIYSQEDIENFMEVYKVGMKNGYKLYPELNSAK